MQKIEIIAAPPGEAPLEIRQAWVGLTLPVATELPPTLEVGVLSWEPKKSIGYPVETRVAIQVLRERNPEAANWWIRHINPDIMPWLYFLADVCRLIP